VNAALRHRVHTALLSRADGRFPALDGLRALAAVTVVCFHCVSWVELAYPGRIASLRLGTIQRLLSNGWMGVDVFFVLSGFLIGRILFLQLQDGGIRFRAFYVRRMFRIFPAYYVVLTVSLLCFAPLHAFAGLYRNTPWTTLLHRSPASYLFVSNYVYGGQATALDRGWSLCIEEHFYLVLPALLAMLFAYWPEGRRRWVALLALAFVPLAARAVTYVSRPRVVLMAGLYFESHTHADGLLMGVLIAYLFVHYGAGLTRVVSRFGSSIAAAGVVCIYASFHWGGLMRPAPFPVIFQFFVLAMGCSFVLVSCLGEDNVVARLFAHRAWHPAARISYGLYLVHPFPLFGIVLLFDVQPGRLLTSLPRFLAFAGGVLSLSFLVAAALFIWLEDPLLQHGARLSSRLGGRGAGLAVVPEVRRAVE